jgi:membrane protein DedA with SNARE-associated domain
VTEQVLTLLAVWGLPLLGIVILLSCFALPLPSSIVILTCGSLVAAGDLSFITTWSVAMIAANLGDQIGYHSGHLFGRRLIHWLDGTPTRHALIDRARHAMDVSGGKTIFLSRWLFSPLGPYVNFLSGAAHYGWRRFTLWCCLGECVWVTGYLSLGYLFGDNINAISEIASDLNGIFAAIGAIIALSWYAHILMKRHTEQISH